MTHIMVLSAKVRRNERSCQTLDSGNMSRPTFSLIKNHDFSNLKTKFTDYVADLLISIFLHGKKLHHLILLSSNWLWAHVL